MRIDKAITILGYADSRQKARKMIEEGRVFLDGNPVKKPSQKYSSKKNIFISGNREEWVSRAGVKLEKALLLWNTDIRNALCLDVGASTGGFTEVLLHYGARKVYSLDVGHGQLAQKLREDSRVVVMEGYNIKDAEKEIFPAPFDIISIDLSFISLKHVLHRISPLIKPEGEIIALIKPQFEAGKKRNKKGVIRDPLLQKKIIGEIMRNARESGLLPKRITSSPTRGRHGNREFLLLLKKHQSSNE